MLKVISLDDKHFAKPLYKDPDNAFFIMQYLEDHQSLAEIFNESYLLQPDSRWYIANELLRIVKILHGSGLAHGDIKPENIMVRVRFPGDPEKQYVDSVKFIDMESLVSSDDIEDDSCGSSGLKRTSSAPPLRTIGTIEFFPPQMKQRVIDPCFTLTLKTFIAYDLWAVGNIILALTFEGYNFPLLGKTPSPDLISKCQERLNERGFPSSLLNIDPSQRRIVNVGRGSRQRSVSY
jgi:serine/threonine protein kinase